MANRRAQVQVCDLQSAESLLRISNELDLLLSNVPQPAASGPNDQNRVTIGAPTTPLAIQTRRKADPGALGRFFAGIFQL